MEMVHLFAPPVNPGHIIRLAYRLSRCHSQRHGKPLHWALALEQAAQQLGAQPCRTVAEAMPEGAAR